MKIDPYLFLNGRCDEALEFYARVLGGEIARVVRFADMPGAPPEMGKYVAHAELRVQSSTMMLSDGHGPSVPIKFEGNALTIGVDDDAEAERLFNDLGAGGTVQMPLGPTAFASRFGMLADKFGLPWMIVSRPT